MSEGREIGRRRASLDMSFSLSLWPSSLRNVLTTGLPGHVLACSAMFSAPGFKAHKQLFGLFDINYMNHRSQVLFSFIPHFYLLVVLILELDTIFFLTYLILYFRAWYCCLKTKSHTALISVLIKVTCLFNTHGPIIKSRSKIKRGPIKVESRVVKSIR